MSAVCVVSVSGFRSALFATLMLSSVLTWASATAFTPARLVTEAGGLQSLVRMPERVADGLYRIRCDAFISVEGRTRDLACHGQQSSDSIRIEQAVIAAGAQARFTPALRNGTPIEVHMTYSVLVRIEAQKALVGVFPNDGEHWTELGMNYVSPQRVDGSFGRLGAGGQIEGVGAASVFLRLSVDALGAVKSADVERKEGQLQRRELAALRQMAMKMTFIPGQHQDASVAMDYLVLYERQNATNQDIRSSGL